MAVLREHPYGRFNFLVDLGTGNTDGPDAGFQECSAIGMEVAVAEYRNGNDKENAPRKITGLTKVGDVTLKRGIVAKENGFWDWWNTIRSGTVQRRTVTISLLNEEHKPVMVWAIDRAWPVKVEGPSLNATGNEIAIETLEFAHEGMSVNAQ